MEDHPKQEAEPAIIQPSRPENPSKEPETVSEIPGDIKAPAETLGAALEDTLLANTQAVSQNVATGKSRLKFLTNIAF